MGVGTQAGTSEIGGLKVAAAEGRGSKDHAGFLTRVWQKNNLLRGLGWRRRSAPAAKDGNPLRAGERGGRPRCHDITGQSPRPVRRRRAAAPSQAGGERVGIALAATERHRAHLARPGSCFLQFYPPQERVPLRSRAARGFHFLRARDKRRRVSDGDAAGRGAARHQYHAAQVPAPTAEHQDTWAGAGSATAGAALGAPAGFALSHCP